MIHYSMGKRCKICGRPVPNNTKVLTCQSCRHEQAEMRKRSEKIGVNP